MADDSLTLAERSVLLALMTLKGEASATDLATAYDTFDETEREHLVGLGYLTARQTGRAWTYELTDKGWRRCEEELASPTPAGAPEATRLQYALTRKFAAYLARNNLRLADTFADGEFTAGPSVVSASLVAGPEPVPPERGLTLTEVERLSG